MTDKKSNSILTLILIGFIIFSNSFIAFSEIKIPEYKINLIFNFYDQGKIQSDPLNIEINREEIIGVPDDVPNDIFYKVWEHHKKYLGFENTIPLKNSPLLFTFQKSFYSPGLSFHKLVEFDTIHAPTSEIATLFYEHMYINFELNKELINHSNNEFYIYIDNLYFEEGYFDLVKDDKDFLVYEDNKYTAFKLVKNIHSDSLILKKKWDFIYAEGKKALFYGAQNGDFRYHLYDAKHYFARLQKMNPHNPEIQEKINLIDRLISDFHQEKYNELISIADSYFKSKDYTHAKTFYQLALKYNPTCNYSSAQTKKCNKKLKIK